MNKINLTVVGNGFDLCHGYKTKYDDFCEYLMSTCYDSCYYPLYEIFQNEGIDWSDFEESLSDVTLESTYKSIIPKFNNNDNDREDEREWRTYEENVENLAECVNELPLDLADAMNDWILKATREKMNKIKVLSDLIAKSDMFVNFNFSTTLESLYEVSDEKILHIHGQAKSRMQNMDHHDPDCGKYEHNTEIIVGHSKDELTNKISQSARYGGMEEAGISPSELCKGLVKPLNLGGLSTFLKNKSIVELHIFGHGLGEVDKKYFRLMDDMLAKGGEVCYYLDPDSTSNDKDKRKKILNSLFHKKKIYLIEYDDENIIKKELL